MENSISIRRFFQLAALGAAMTLVFTASQAAVNPEAATALAKKNDCLKCHAVDKDKKATSFRKISESWKGKADAEAKLMDAITKSPKVKMKDGTEEEHKAIGTKDPAELKNLIGWILSL